MLGKEGVACTRGSSFNVVSLLLPLKSSGTFRIEDASAQDGKVFRRHDAGRVTLNPVRNIRILPMERQANMIKSVVGQI